MTAPPPTPRGRARLRWALLAVAGVLALVAAVAALAGFARRDPSPAPDPEVARAVAAIGASFTQGEGGVFYPPGYGRCVGAQTVEATGVQVLVDDGYLTTDLTRAARPAEVTTMSEGVATAWADARVECQDREATAAWLEAAPRSLAAGEVAAYGDCLDQIGGEEERTALRKQAMGVTGPDVDDYLGRVAACAADLQ